jgi:hypothetical protein
MPKKPKKPAREDYRAPHIAGSGREWTKWWEIDEDGVGQALEDRIRQLWEDDEPRRLDIERSLKRWGLSLAGLYADPAIRIRDTLRVNLTKSLTETITAKVGKNRPRPLVLTDNGKFANKAKAKKLQRFLDAAYNQANVYEQLPLWFRNAMLMGTGILHVTGNAHRQRFIVENIFPLECLVDNVEGTSGTPRCFYRLHPEDKDTLQEDHPTLALEIESAAMYGPEATLPTATILNGAHRDVRACMVSEGWRLARYNRAGEYVAGRHVKSVNGCVLIDEEWDAESFPFVFHHWNAPVRGFWGDSAVSEIRGFETEANILLQRASDAMHRTGLATLLVHRDAKIQQVKTTNEPMAIMQWEGQVPPTVTTGQPIHPQIMDTPSRLMGMAANQLGTNELQMSASKPAGIESGRALEQLSEEHAVRFDTVSKAFEIAASKALAIQLVQAAKRMDAQLKEEGESGLRLRSTYKKEFIDLAWDDVELGPEELFIEVFPVSVLPHTPAGRTAEVERWQGNKWISADEAKSLLDFPDLESVASVSRASFDLLEWQLEQLLDEGHDIAPDPRQDLELARRFGTHAKLKAQREGYPQAHINLLEDFLTAVEDLIAPPPTAPTDPSLTPGMDATMAAGAPAPIAPDPMGPGLGATPGVTAPQVQMQLQ